MRTIDKAFSVSPAAANCEVLFADQKENSNFVREMMSHNGDRVARICQYGAGRQPTYYRISDTRIGRLGLCEYSEVLVTSEHDFSPTNVTYILDGTSNTICPPQQDTRYINTGNITEGTAVGILRFWKVMASSEKTFSSIVKGSAKTTLDTQIVARIRRQLFGTDRSDRPKIVSMQTMSLPPSVDELVYQVTVTDVDTSGRIWSLYLDYTERGFQVLKIESRRF
jgi:hypothetical protein